MISDSTITHRLNQLTTANIGGEHTSGGDSLLPPHLRGSSIDLPRMPSIAEVRSFLPKHGELDKEDLDAAICAASEHLWVTLSDLSEWPYCVIDQVCFGIEE